MDDRERHHTDGPWPVDLAAIVLDGEAGRRGHGRSRSAVAAMPPHAWSEADHPIGLGAGYDARSVLVLALVVAALVATVAWTTSIGSGDGPGSRDVAPSSSGGLGDAAEMGAAAAAAPATVVARRQVVAPAPAPGVDLAPASVGLAKSASGGAVARVVVANVGADPLADGTGARIVVLIDGVVAGETTLGALEGDRTRATLDVPIDTCSSGRHMLTALVDVGASVPDTDVADNALSRRVQLAC